MNEAPKMSPVPGLQTPVAVTKSTPEKLMFWNNFFFYADMFVAVTIGPMLMYLWEKGEIRPDRRDVWMFCMVLVFFMIGSHITRLTLNTFCENTIANKKAVQLLKQLVNSSPSS
jgi:hypothetical protein